MTQSPPEAAGDDVLVEDEGDERPSMEYEMVNCACRCVGDFGFPSSGRLVRPSSPPRRAAPRRAAPSRQLPVPIPRHLTSPSIIYTSPPHCFIFVYTLPPSQCKRPLFSTPR